MRFKDAIEHYTSGGDKDLLDYLFIIIDSDGDTLFLSERNFRGGKCDCCSDLSYDDLDNAEVVKIIKGPELEVIYERT